MNRSCKHCGRAIPPYVSAVVLDFVVLRMGEELEFLPFVDERGAYHLDPVFVLATDEEEALEVYPGHECEDPEEDTPLAPCWDSLSDALRMEAEDFPPTESAGALATCEFCESSLMEGKPCMRVTYGTFEPHKLDMRFVSDSENGFLACARCAHVLNGLSEENPSDTYPGQMLWLRDVRYALTGEW